VKLATHLCLVPILRMRGAILTLLRYVFMAWCSVKYTMRPYSMVIQEQGKLYHCFILSVQVPYLYYNYQGMGALSSNIEADGVRRSVHKQVTPMRRMRGASPPRTLYAFMAWCLCMGITGCVPHITPKSRAMTTSMGLDGQLLPSQPTACSRSLLCMGKVT